MFGFRKSTVVGRSNVSLIIVIIVNYSTNHYPCHIICTVYMQVQYLKSTWHSHYILVYIEPLLIYLLVSVPSILTLRYISICVCVCMFAFPNAFSFLILLWVTSCAWNPVPFEPSDDASSRIRSQLRQQRFSKYCRFTGCLGKDLAHLVHPRTIQKLSTKSWDSHYPTKVFCYIAWPRGIGFPLLQLVDSNLLRVLGPSFSRYHLKTMVDENGL